MSRRSTFNFRNIEVPEHPGPLLNSALRSIGVVLLSAGARWICTPAAPAVERARGDPGVIEKNGAIFPRLPGTGHHAVMIPAGEAVPNMFHAFIVKYGSPPSRYR